MQGFIYIVCGNAAKRALVKNKIPLETKLLKLMAKYFKCVSLATYFLLLILV